MNLLYEIPLRQSCMYLRGDVRDEALPDAAVRDTLTLRPGECIRTDTYYGCFPCGSWHEHTAVRNVWGCAEVAGSGKLSLYHCQEADAAGTQSSTPDKTPAERKLAETSFSCTEARTLRLHADLGDCTAGYLYLRVEAEPTDPVKISSLYYEGEAAGERRETRIAVILCTFRREEYVQTNLRILAEACSRDEDLREHLTVFCVDNGRTLTEVPDGIRLILNPNCGGSGGYARGMLEAGTSAQPFTHFWLMDDDILFDPCILRKAVCFLTFRAREDLRLAAGMFSFEQPCVQQEATAEFGGYSFVSNAGGLDFSIPESLLQNRIHTTPHTYGGWWSLVMPAGDLLPMPFFIKLDDIEYGLRSGGEYAVMNGFGVWHEAFGKKANAWSEYYTTRNTLITQALHPDLPHNAVKMMGVRLLKALAYGEEKCMEAACAGAEDFLAGPGRLRSIDPEQNHVRVRQQYGAPLEQNMGRADIFRAAAANICTPAGRKCVRLYGRAVSRLLREAGRARRADWESLRAPESWRRHLQNGNTASHHPGTECISVIIPVYNVAAYLPQCLESVCRQTYSNLEILLVDDGSTDGSGSICDDWAARDSRIRVIHRKNGGVSAARNAGLRAARGTLIGFADADDWLERDMYEKLAARLQDAGPDVAVAVSGYYDYPFGMDRPVSCGTDPAGLCGPEQAAVQLLARDGYGVIVWNKLFRRSAVMRDGRGIAFSEQLSFGEDEVWLLRVLQNVRSVVFLPEALYHWRKREGSITQFRQVTETERGLLKAKKAALSFLPDDEAVRDLAKAKTYNDCYALKLQAYYAQDTDSFRHVSASLAPMRRAWLRSADVPLLRKLKVLALDLQMQLRFPVKLIETEDYMSRQHR